MSTLERAGADKIGLTGSTALVPVLALVALWAGRSSQATTS